MYSLQKYQYGSILYINKIIVFVFSKLTLHRFPSYVCRGTGSVSATIHSTLHVVKLTIDESVKLLKYGVLVYGQTEQECFVLLISYSYRFGDRACSVSFRLDVVVYCF